MVAPELSVGQRRARTPVLVALAVAVGVAVAALAWSASSPAVPGPSATDPAPAAVPPPSAARELGLALTTAVAHGDRAAFAAAWTPPARARATQVFANLRNLGAAAVFTLDDPAAPAGESAELPARVTWRLPGGPPATTALAARVVPGPAGARLAGLTAAPGAVPPLWLLGALAVERRPGVLAAAADPAAADSLARGLRQARRDLAVMGVGAPRTVTAFAPSSQRGFERLAGAAPGQLSHIAAVNAPMAPAPAGARSAQLIVVNPRVWSSLSPAGARVVLTHEATHQATGAADATGPRWLVEGYADWVALGAAGIGPRVAASAALRHAAEQGPPARLPAAAAFADARPGRQQRAYTWAWLAVRGLERAYGREPVARLYRLSTGRGLSLPAAAAAALDVGPGAIVAAWQAEIERWVDAR